MLDLRQDAEVQIGMDAGQNARCCKDRWSPSLQRMLDLKQEIGQDLGRYLGLLLDIDPMQLDDVYKA